MTPRTLFRTATVLAVALAVTSERPPVGLSAQQAPRSIARAGQTVTRLADGRSLIVGGESGTASASIWNPVTQTSAATAGAPIVPRTGHSATLLSDGTVLIAGGRNAAGLVATAELFEPATGVFRQVSIVGASPRASHTATLLMDGRVLVAGGTAGVDGPLPTEIWNVAAQSAAPVGSGGVDREGHAATLMPDGTVLFTGGRALGVRSQVEGLILDPSTGSITPAAADRRNDSEPAVSAFMPTADATDVETDMHVALRFSVPVAPETVTGEHITLTGPNGTVNTVLVVAESGRLAFAWPDAPLSDGATYTVTAAGLTDVSGRALAPLSFRFTTRQRPPDQADVVDRETWSPDVQAGEKGWRTNRPPSPWESLAPLMAAPGVTAVSGRVLRLDGAPLKDVTLTIEGHETRTDGTGRFLLPLEGWTSRATTLEIDGATASTPNRTYGFYEARIGVYARQTNVLPFTIWSPRIDTAHQVAIPSPTTSETLVTTPTMPGLELHLPAGTVIRGEDREVVKAVSITPIPLDRTPFPLPENATFSMFFTIQPGGAYLSTPGPIRGGWLVYPNVNRSRTGSRVQFFNYDPNDKGWYPYGMGTITGTTVVPEPKTRIYAFTGASFNDATPTPPSGPPPGDCCSDDGDPVNLPTGVFTHEMTDLVVPDVLPLVLTRSYNSQDPYNRAFGTGMSHSFGLFQHSEAWPSQVDLYLPDGAKVHFDRISDPALNNSDTVFEHTATPTGLYQARMFRWENSLLDAGWQVSRTDGIKYLFPHAGSPLQAIRDRYGNEIRLTWESGLLRRVTSPNGRWIAFIYGPGGRVSQVSDNIGRTVSYTYDANGNLLTVTDPEQHVTSYGWTANNQMASVKPRNLYGTQTNLVTNEYTTAADAPTPVGWVKKQTHADGGVFQFAYTVSNGKSTQTDVTNPRGYVRRVTFNTAGYTLSDVRARGQAEQQTNTSDRPGTNNFVTSATDTKGAVTATDFDELGRVWRVTRLPGTPDEAVTTYTYDPVWKNEIATVTDPLNHTVTFEYDERGNRKSLIDALNHKTSFTFNERGQVTSVTDPLQHATLYEYAGPDLVKITDPLGRVTRRFFDAGGRMLSETDPAGRTTQLVYDKRNHVTRVTDPLGGITAYGYEASGGLETVTDALNHTINYEYDAFNRLTRRTDPLAKVESFAYDLNGNSVQRTDRKGQMTTQTYDSLDRLQQVTYADNSTVTYGYDSGNRLRTIADSANGTITRDYDSLDRLTSETTPQGTVSYTYDKADRRATMIVTGQPQVTYGYDEADRLRTVTQNGFTVTITYDEANRRSTLTLPNGVVATYGYDNANQLTSLTYDLGQTTLGTLTYAYDLAGRRTEVGGTWARTGLPQALSTATFDAANRMLSRDGQNFSYDLNGNLASDGLTSYTWNVRDQLGALTGGVTANFTYDAVNRRRGKTIGSTSRSFLYDGLTTVQELSAGTPTANLLTGLGMDEVFRRVDGTGTRDPLTDALGSTVALSTTSGAPQTSYTYEPFGATTVSGATSPNAAQFTGRENDETGLYYYRARYLGPTMSRFISEDPAGSVGGNNFYQYADGSPTNLIDPTGLCAAKSCGIKTAPEYNVSGTIAGGTPFTWKASFLNDATHDPACCEVRQLISWDKNTPTPPHSGFPNSTQPGTWYEDRDQANKRYGRRSGRYSDPVPGGGDEYRGNNYSGRDRPSGFPPGATLKFRLIVADVCDGGKTIFTSRTLTVKF
ncbi:MAG TPA: RHS repeat-associated core domain-containing protein [Vicinamibacterales bacterium]|nr:RHS repeat-associated core domain-containing protein [Vicinamibacterales bacterium]